jgi:replicative DNA helicase
VKSPSIMLEPMNDRAAAAEDTTPGSLLRLSDLTRAWENEAERRHTARECGHPLGVRTGLESLDTALGGYLEVGLHVAHGQPGAGKTALAWQIAASCGCPALYVTCEMAPLELLRRLTARVTETYLGRLKTGELAPKEMRSLLERALTAAPKLALLDATTANIPPDRLLQASRAIKGNDAHFLLVVDSLHSWANYSGASEYEGLNRGLADLQEIAYRLECPVLVLAERSRAAMNAGGLSAGAGTRKLEYAAVSVLDLARDEEESPLDQIAGEQSITLTVVKNRSGAAGVSVDLSFHGALQRFRERAAL